MPGAAFSQNGYNGTVLPNSTSLLTGQPAFIENSPNYGGGPITSVCTLGNFATGDSVRVAFMAASDGNTQGQWQPNWQIDSLQVSVADPPVTPITVTGIQYGSSSNVVCLAVSPDLVPDTQVYFVIAQDVHDTEGVVIAPNPSTCTLLHGAEYPVFRILEKRFDNIGGVTVADLTNQRQHLLHSRPEREAASTLPVLVCGPDRMVECGQPWTFTPATATDNCSGVASLTETTVDNGNVHTRTWVATPKPAFVLPPSPASASEAYSAVREGWKGLPAKPRLFGKRKRDLVRRPSAARPHRGPLFSAACLLPSPREARDPLVPP